MKRTRVLTVAAAVCGGVAVALGLAVTLGAVTMTANSAALLFGAVALAVTLGAAAGISAANR